MAEARIQCNSNNKTVMFEDFKLMVKNIAEDINNLSKLMYMCGMNSTGSDRDKMTALDILWKLEKQGKFAHNNVGPLESLLRGIDRCDLVTKHIDPYKHKYAVKQRPISLPPWPAHSSLLNIAATKPRSQTDPVQCTQDRYCQQYPQQPYCDTVTEEEPASNLSLSSAVQTPFLPRFQSSGSQCSVATTPVQAQIQHLERQSRVESNNNSSFSRSQTPSTLQCSRWSSYSARSDTCMSAPIGSRAQRNSRPSNISLDAELQESFGQMNIGSTASSMASLPTYTSSSDMEQWSGSTDDQEMLSFYQPHSAADTADRREWHSRGNFLLDCKKMAKMIAAHKICHFHQYGQNLTIIIPMSQSEQRGIKLTFEVFPYGIDADIQSRHATVLVRVSQHRLSLQEIADNCICTVKVKANFVNSMTKERLSSREGEAELNPTSCEACIQINQALSHSDILYSAANIQMLVEAEFHCLDKVVAAMSGDQDCSDYVIITYTPNEQ